MGKTTITAPQNSHEIVMERTFDASPEKIFKAYTDPTLVAQWWGGGLNTSTIVDVLEAKAGGKWRFVEKGQDGSEFGFHGIYHEVTPRRIVDTFEFEGMPGHVLMETISFEPLGDSKTKMVSQSVFQSIEARDGMLASDMENGANASLDKLETLLATL